MDKENCPQVQNAFWIASQYFMGSAYGWLDDQDVHCYNVIPMEITQKICESIDAGRRLVLFLIPTDWFCSYPLQLDPLLQSQYIVLTNFPSTQITKPINRGNWPRCIFPWRNMFTILWLQRATATVPISVSSFLFLSCHFLCKCLPRGCVT